MPSKYALPMFRRWGVRRMWRYPFHRLPPFADAAAKHGYGFQVWGWGVMLHGKEQGLFIGWLKRTREGESDGE